MQKLFGLIKSVSKPTAIADEEGVIRLQKKNGKVYMTDGKNWENALLRAVDNMTDYNDGGKTLPNTYLIFGKRILDLSGLLDEAQMKSLAEVELAAVREDDQLMILTSARTD